MVHLNCNHHGQSLHQSNRSPRLDNDRTYHSCRRRHHPLWCEGAAVLKTEDQSPQVLPRQARRHLNTRRQSRPSGRAVDAQLYIARPIFEQYPSLFEHCEIQLERSMGRQSEDELDALPRGRC